jgi:hypothetical protein
MKLRMLSMGLALALAAVSCSDDNDDTPASGGAGGVGGSSTGGSGGLPAEFSLTSSAFSEGESIPQRHACTSGGGENISPPLAWTAGPAGTQSYAVIMRDRDFQNGFLHWVIWDIPAGEHALPENVEAGFEPSAPAGAKQAPFVDGTVAYFGPCSPNTVNTYEFTVHALPTATLAGLDATSTMQQAATAIEAASLASAALAGES